MRVFCGLVAMALVACGGGTQSAVDGQAGAASLAGGAGAGEPAGGAQAAAGARTVGVSSIGAAGGADVAARGGAAGSESGAGGAPAAGASGSMATRGGDSMGGAAGGGSGGPPDVSAGAGGAPDPGAGTLVVSWTVGGVAYDAGSNPGMCECVDQFGNATTGSSSIVLGYGRLGQPLDSGASVACGEVDLTKKSVPATELNFKIYLSRAFTKNQNSSLPDYALDPAVTFTATVAANQTTHVLVDFPAMGAAGATYSLMP